MCWLRTVSIEVDENDEAVTNSDDDTVSEEVELLEEAASVEDASVETVLVEEDSVEEASVEATVEVSVKDSIEEDGSVLISEVLTTVLETSSDDLAVVTTSFDDVECTKIELEVSSVEDDTSLDVTDTEVVKVVETREVAVKVVEFLKMSDEVSAAGSCCCWRLTF